MSTSQPDKVAMFVCFVAPITVAESSTFFTIDPIFIYVSFCGHQAFWTSNRVIHVFSNLGTGKTSLANRIDPFASMKRATPMRRGKALDLGEL